MNLQNLEAQVEELVENMLKENAKLVSASLLNLDARCGNVYVGSDFIAVKSYSNRSIRYYGGFEYVDDSDIVHMGEYVIYKDNSERVYDAIEFFNHNHNETV